LPGWLGGGLDSHANRLRRKLDPDAGRFIVNCWGVRFGLLTAGMMDTGAG
jgi:hypothetical protein